MNRPGMKAVLLVLLGMACGEPDQLIEPISPSPSPPPAPVQYPLIAGAYELEAPITSSDPAWGIPDGTRQLATLTINQSDNDSTLVGTFTNFRAVASDGETLTGAPGVLRGSVDRNGWVIVELFIDVRPASYWYGEGTFSSGRIAGDFGAGGHISGTFLAQRK